MPRPSLFPNFPRCLLLATRTGAPIPNIQDPRIAPHHKRYASDVIKAYRGAISRVPFSSTYNCHGLTFASRRTVIEDISVIGRILTEDDYILVDGKSVMPGDIIVYFHRDSGEIEHTGIVVEMGTAPLFIHRICSKWGAGPEMIHWANDCPYKDTELRYYRIHK